MVIWALDASSSYGWANSGYAMLADGESRRMGIQTRYQPVGLPVSPNFEWEVRTKRTFGCDIVRRRRGVNEWVQNVGEKKRELNEM